MSYRFKIYYRDIELFDQVGTILVPRESNQGVRHCGLVMSGLKMTRIL